MGYIESTQRGEIAIILTLKNQKHEMKYIKLIDPEMLEMR
jgi:hypothetical protein